MHDFVNTVVAFVQAHQAWAAPVAFGLAFGESLAFVSLVVPATVILVTIGGLLGASDIDVWPIVIAAGFGGALGYSVSYWIGLYFKDSITSYWPFRAYPKMMRRGGAAGCVATPSSCPLIVASPGPRSSMVAAAPLNRSGIRT